MNFEQEILEELKNEEISEEEREELQRQLNKIRNRELPSSDEDSDYEEEMALINNKSSQEFFIPEVKMKQKKIRKRKKKDSNLLDFDYKNKRRFNPRLPPPGDRFKPKDKKFNFTNDDFPSL